MAYNRHPVEWVNVLVTICGMSQPQEASRVEILDAMEGPMKFLSIPNSFIACHSKDSFLHDPTCPTSEQPLFPLVWEQDLDQEQIPFSLSHHREYNIWGIINPKLFYFSFLFPKCCQPKYIWLLFGPFQTYSVILKMYIIGVVGTWIENWHHFILLNIVIV